MALRFEQNAQFAASFLSWGYFWNGLNIWHQRIDTRAAGKVFRLGKYFYSRRQARLA